MPLKQGTSDVNMKNKTNISWDNVSLNPTCVEQLEIVCIKWRKNVALAEHCFITHLDITLI